MKKNTLLAILIISCGGILAYLHNTAKKYIKIINDGTSWGDYE